MESKLDFFTLPERRNLIYPNLSIYENARLRCISKDIKAEITKYFWTYYNSSNRLAFDRLNISYEIDENIFKLTHKFETHKIDKTEEIEWIKNNVIFQQFLHDDYSQYKNSQLCIENEDHNLDTVTENQIIVRLQTHQTPDIKINAATEVYLNLINTDPDDSEHFDQYKKNLRNIFSRIFYSNALTDEALEEYLKNRIDELEDVEVEEKKAAFEMYKFKTTELLCRAISHHHSHQTCVIQNTSDYKWVKPLTSDQLLPFELEIKNLLSKASVLDLVDHILNDKYKPLFGYKNFQYCYYNEKISHKQMSHFITTKSIRLSKLDDMASVVRKTWLQLDWLAASRSFDVTQYFLENPDEVIYLNKAENKEKILYILNYNLDYSPSLAKKLVTLEECIKFGDQLFKSEKFLYDSHPLDPRKATRHEMELFCKGLGSPEQYSKGLAIKALQTYGKELQAEKDKIEHMHAGFSAYITNGFFKQMYGDVRAEQCKAINALIAVLRKTPNCHLTQEQIEVLTNTLGTEQEDPLATVIRATLLEPLQIDSLRDLDLECTDQPGQVSRI